MLKKIIKEAGALSWTLAGTALVLITLSGDIQNQALWISGAALAVHLVSVIVAGDDEENSTIEETPEE
jgi:hypothetical protein